MNPARQLRYEIFQKFAERQPVWVGTAESLGDAKRRVEELARCSPGDYFIFDTVTVCFVFQHDPEAWDCAKPLDCKHPGELDG